MGDDALDDLVGKVREHFEEHQPDPASFPAMAARVMEMAERQDVDINQLVHLIEREPAICAAVLRVANSALYRRAASVSAVRTAVTMIGLRHVAGIAVGVACRALFDVELRVQHDLYPNWWNRLYHSAMTEAFAACFLARERRLRASESLFLAGMFHDIGKSLALRSLSALVIDAKLPGIPDDNAIEEILRRVHVGLGVLAQAAWGFPEELIEATRRHYDEHVPEGAAWIDTHLIRLVSVLNDLRLGTLETGPLLGRLNDSTQALGLSKADVVTIAQQVSEYAGQVGILFSTTDGADETGYLDFVKRCMEP